MEKAVMSKLPQIGVFKHASSPWAACNVFFKKEDGITMVSSDFSGLNALTVADFYHMEDVCARLDWIRSKQVFSTFDLKDEFSQVGLDEDSRNFPAIRTAIRLLRYVRLSQGLKNSKYLFQRVVNAILGKRKGRNVPKFMDDIIMDTITVEEHLQCLL